MKEIHHNQIILPDHVLVNPDLEEDAVNKQGQIGVITAGILNTDEFYLGLDDKQVGIYSADAILGLKHPEELHACLLEQAEYLSGTDFTDLKLIMELATRETPVHSRAAIEIARTNPVLLAAATVPLSEMLGLELSRRPGR